MRTGWWCRRCRRRRRCFGVLFPERNWLPAWQATLEVDGRVSHASWNGNKGTEKGEFPPRRQAFYARLEASKRKGTKHNFPPVADYHRKRTALAIQSDLRSDLIQLSPEYVCVSVLWGCLYHISFRLCCNVYTISLLGRSAEVPSRLEAHYYSLVCIHSAPRKHSRNAKDNKINTATHRMLSRPLNTILTTVCSLVVWYGLTLVLLRVRALAGRVISNARNALWWKQAKLLRLHT